ncbi:YxeA family protein [Lacticaseibacillus parakribbianus]|uniref:YxeA family protein n=1 Tax=Lacticaseibacillus parakribbianus TaxID=2970927 RepID=UPI0021CB749F|nr:YxeA family protein [Lacticaseibacillus parakribbianus]
MRRWVINSVGLLVILGTLCCTAPLVTRDRTTAGAAVLDAINPLVTTQEYYASTAAAPTRTANAHGGRDYHYRLTAYDRGGRPRRLLITVTDQPLQSHTYLRVQAKGQTSRAGTRCHVPHFPKACGSNSDNLL